jgi:ketosteroid isomerase-like protein
MPTLLHRMAVPMLSAAMAAFAFLSLACGPQSASSDSALAVMLKTQADAWDHAIIRKDAKAIADNMSADFRHIGKTGDMSDRAAFLQSLQSADLVIHPYTVEDFDVRIYGDCALLCGRTRMTGTYQGKPFRSHYRYIDTYVRQDGRWRVCSVQVTALPE